jgi:hypothetical protein
MLHCGPPDLLRRHLSHQLVFVNERPKHGLRLLVKDSESLLKHSLKPCRREGTNLRFFVFVAIRNLMGRLRRVSRRVAGGRLWSLVAVVFSAQISQALQHRWLFFRVRVRFGLAVAELISTSRPDRVR